MTKKKNDFENIVDEALENARQDREKVLGEITKLKDVFSGIDMNDTSTQSSAMLLGDKVCKLLESLTKNNEQLVRLAQIKEKQESREKGAQNKPINLDDLKDDIDEYEVEGEPFQKYRV